MVKKKVSERDVGQWQHSLRGLKSGNSVCVCPTHPPTHSLPPMPNTLSLVGVVATPFWTWRFAGMKKKTRLGTQRVTMDPRLPSSV